MKKIKRFKSGGIWLNVFETDDGQNIVTIKKSYISNGEWQSTPFFNADRGDLEHVKKALEQYEESVNEVVVQ